jgi:non-specific serine/threonine protein kinase
MTASAEAGGLRYQFENIEYDEIAALLCVDGEPVNIEPRPLQVLAELLRHAGEVVTKEELFDRVWDGRPTVDNVLANAVSKLRGVLGEAGAARIVTVPRVGYRLTGPVQRIEAGAAPQTLQAGQPVPAREGYVLERPLGRGSRSDVWLARHAKLGQAHVFKFADDGARLTALKREYTLYRVLKQELGPRDDFAVVIDSNFAAAPYFLECEYGGQSLLEWAEEDDRLAQMPQPERLALFVQIASAVAAAHSVGVLHKDLKPGNVLVSGQPGVWQARLTDFGSGRLLDATRLAGLQVTALGLTHTQDVAPDSISGTYMYLAPEVMAGQAPGTQSDVFALGLMLYQLVVGDLRRPLVTGWEREVEDDLLRDDIRAATEGRPQARLASAAELAWRIEHLDARRSAAAARAAELLSAQRAQAQAARDRARRPWVLAASLCLMLGLGLSLWQARQARQAQARAEAAAANAEAVDDFLAQDLLAANDLARAGPNKPLTLLDLLRRGAASAGERFRNQPQTEAAVRLHLARAFAKLWASTDASLQYDIVLDLLKKQLPPGDERLLSLQFEYVNLMFEMNQKQEALALFDAAEAQAGSARMHTASELAVLALRARITVESDRGQAARALDSARELLAMSESVPGVGSIYRIVARSTLASALQNAGQVEEAQRLMAELTVPPLSLNPESTNAWAWVNMMQASGLRDAGRPAQAQRLLLETLARLDAAARPSTWHLGYAHSELGNASMVAQDFKLASESYRQAMKYFALALGEEHQFYRITASNLAESEASLGHFKAALQICLDHEAWFKEHASRGFYPQLEVTRGRALIGLGRQAEALAPLERVLGLHIDGTGEQPSIEHWHAQALHGMALMAVGRLNEGLASAQAAYLKLSQADKLPTDLPELNRFFAAQHWRVAAARP